MPDERGSSSQTPWQRAATVAGALILAIVAVAVLDGPFAFVGPGLVLLGLAALVGVLLWRSEAGRGAGPLLVRALAVCGIVVLAAAGTVAVAVGAAAGGGAVIAALLIVTGIAMAVAAYAGGARWMILPAAVIALPLGLVAATDLDLDGGVGDREYRPAAVGEVRDSYELGAGELTVDLRDVTLPQGRTEIDLDVGIGAAVVIVPDDVCVSTDVTLGVGGAEVLGRENGGVDVEYERGHAAAAGDVPRLVLDGHVGVGAFEVYRERYADRSLVRDWDDDWDGWDRRDRFGEDRVFAPREDGCGRAL